MAEKTVKIVVKKMSDDGPSGDKYLVGFKTDGPGQQHKGARRYPTATTAKKKAAKLKAQFQKNGYKVKVQDSL